MIKQKTIVLSVEQKLQLMNKHENGAKISTLMREYNVGEQTVRDLIKNKPTLITFAGVSDSADGMSKRKSMKFRPTMDWIKPWFYGSVSKEHRRFLFLEQYALLKQSIFSTS
jgi:hypothetical protein